MNSKIKGRNAERELAKELNSLLGSSCRRGQQFKGGADSPDVDGLPFVHIECKRVERLNIENAMDQSKRDCGDKIPTVMHRRNRKEWLVTMRLKDWAFFYDIWAQVMKKSLAELDEAILKGVKDETR